MLADVQSKNADAPGSLLRADVGAGALLPADVLIDRAGLYEGLRGNDGDPKA